MKIQLIAALLLTTVAFYSSAQTKHPISVLATHKINSDGGWDYLSVDHKNNNIFVSHGNQVNVLSRVGGDSVGIIHNTMGVHGITVVNAQGKGYTTNGKAGTCTIFDLKNFTVQGEIRVGANPDATFYDDFSAKVLVFNGKSHDVSIIDPLSDKVVASIPLGGKPEAGVSDGKGKIFVNIEDTGEIVCFDSRTFKVLSRYKLQRGEEPSGLAIDRSTSRLFTVCANKVMLILDAKTGKQIKIIPIGDGCDGVVFDPFSKTIFCANGEGTVTVVKELSADKFVVQQTVKSARGARTIALDPISHHIFLPTAEVKEGKDSAGKPLRIPGTFRVLEMGESL